MKISDEVLNCLINQAIVLKHDSDQSGNKIAKAVVEEYFNAAELNAGEKEQLISRLCEILGR